MIKKYHIRVVSNAQTEKIIPFQKGYKVYVSASPTKGKANKRVQRLLSEYFHVSYKDIVIAKGVHSRDKIVTVSF